MRRNWGITTFAIAILAVALVAAADLDEDQNIANVNARRVEIPTECPKIDPMDTTVHLAHESDCTKFYMCAHGHRVLFDCPVMDADGNRLHFNPVLQVCDWPNKAGCINGPTTPSTPGTSTTITIELTTEQNVTTSTVTDTTTKTTEASTIWTTEVSNESTIGTSGSSTELSTETHETMNPASSTEVATESTTEITSPTLSTEILTEQSTEGTATTPTLESSTEESLESMTTWSSTEITATPESSTGQSTEVTGTTETQTYSTEKLTEPTIEVTSSPRPSTEQSTEETGTTGTQTYSTEKLTEPTIEVTSSPRPSTEQSTEETGTTGTQTYSTEKLTEPTIEVTSSPGPSTEQSTEATGTTGTQTDGTEILTQPTIEVTSSPGPSTEQSTEGTGGTATQTDATEILTESTTRLSSSWWPTQETSSQDPPSEPSTDTTETVTTITELPTSSFSTETPSTTTPITITVDQPDTPKPPGTLKPHDTNCSLYWEIDGDDKILKECPVGLHFNPDTEVCELPENAGCIATPPPPVTNSTIPDVTCGIPCGQTGHGMTTPHECSCSKYYRCSNGDLILQECSKGLHYNPTTSTCDWPDSAGCALSTVKPATTAPIQTDCPTDSSGQTILIPHLTNCSLYYKCEDSKKLLLQCADDLHFNPQIQSCDWPDSASCISTIAPPEIDTTSENKLTTRPLVPSGTNDPWDGISTVPVIPSEPPTTQSPSKNTISAGTSKTTDKVTVKPPVPTSIPTSPQQPSITDLTTSTASVIGSECPTDGSGGRIPHESDCSLYYECVNGKKELVHCTSGLYFSPKLQMCVWPQHADCKSATDLPNASTKPVQSTSPVPIPTDDLQQPQTERPTVDPSTSQPSTGSSGRPNCIGSCPIKDPTDYTVLLPNEDCTLFCKCSNGRPYIYDCPPGLHFNPIKFVCDYPNRAKCRGIGGFGNRRYEDFFFGI